VAYRDRMAYLSNWLGVPRAVSRNLLQAARVAPQLQLPSKPFVFAPRSVQRKLGGPALRKARRAALGPTKEPLELVGVQPVPANHRAVEEQDWNVQAIAADKLRIGVHVHDIDGRQPDPAPKGFQLPDHLIAQITVLPVHHRQSGLGGAAAKFVAKGRQASPSLMVRAADGTRTRTLC
jgi:hypothetical protein